MIEAERTLVLQSVSFIVTPSTASVSHRQSAVAAAFVDSCDGSRNDKRDAVCRSLSAVVAQAVKYMFEKRAKENVLTSKTPF
jgi:hypothetical protein